MTFHSRQVIDVKTGNRTWEGPGRACEEGGGSDTIQDGGQKWKPPLPPHKHVTAPPYYCGLRTDLILLGLASLPDGQYCVGINLYDLRKRWGTRRMKHALGLLQEAMRAIVARSRGPGVVG